VSKAALYEQVADVFNHHKLGHFLLALHDCAASPATIAELQAMDEAVLLGPQVRRF